MRRLLVVVFILNALPVIRSTHAQNIRREDFIPLDTAIVRLGPMPDSSLGAIAHSLTSLCHNQAEMVHAYYFWTAHYIEFDCKAWHHAGKQNNSVTNVLRYRKAVSEGYAELFRQLCNVGHIQCLTVSGWAKSFPADIGTIQERQRHYWNIVTIDDRQYAMDATWAAGGTDKRVRHFSPEYSDAWYGTNRRLFSLCHFPDNKAHQLLDTPLIKTVYSQAPIIGPAAVGLDIFPEEGARGRIRSRAMDSVVVLSYWVKKPEKIRGITVFSEAGGMQPVPFEVKGNVLTARLPVAEGKPYEATLMVNGGVAFGYQVQGRKGKR